MNFNNSPRKSSEGRKEFLNICNCTDFNSPLFVISTRIDFSSLIFSLILFSCSSSLFLISSFPILILINFLHLWEIISILAFCFSSSSLTFLRIFSSFSVPATGWLVFSPSCSSQRSSSSSGHSSCHSPVPISSSVSSISSSSSLFSSFALLSISSDSRFFLLFALLGFFASFFEII